MAATGYTPISLYYSSTTTNVPLAANLVNGELALNIADGKLFYKDSGGVVQVLATKGAGTIGGSNTQIQFNNSGALGGSANLTWNGTSLAVTGTVAVTGALTATLDSTFSSTGALLISKGTTAQQPGSPSTGMLRYNTTTNSFEGYSGSSPAWNPVGGVSLSNDTSTSSNIYPLFAAATSGAVSTIYTGNSSLLYKPSTGELTAVSHLSSSGLTGNSNTVAASYSLPSGYNAMSAGPITVNTGVTVTVPTGSTWTVV
jgi:hypothetical protein